MARADNPESEGGDRHLHVRIADERTTYYDLVTEFLQAAGKAPDWYWRLVGSFGHAEAERMEEIIASAFEAGAYISHDHPEDLEFDWVTEDECEEEKSPPEEQQPADYDPSKSGGSPAAPRRSQRESSPLA